MDFLLFVFALFVFLVFELWFYRLRNQKNKKDVDLVVDDREEAERRLGLPLNRCFNAETGELESVEFIDFKSGRVMIHFVKKQNLTKS